jgi:O-acetyl-ADP-ribose deacetylase (regulator of RNase III)
VLSACDRDRGGARHAHDPFPCISTGVYGYPAERAAKVAVTAVEQAVSDRAGIEEVIFCCFSASDLGLYTALLSRKTP